MTIQSPFFGRNNSNKNFDNSQESGLNTGSEINHSHGELIAAEHQLEEEVQWLAKNHPNWDLKIRENAAVRWLHQGISFDKINAVFGKELFQSAYKRFNSRMQTSAHSSLIGNSLTIESNVKLNSAEITDCDSLIVDGFVNANLDARIILVGVHGIFKGLVYVDTAEIHGSFEGRLVVREKLVIHSTGSVNGNIQYSALIIEDGGQISGEVFYHRQLKYSEHQSQYIKRGLAA